MQSRERQGAMVARDSSPFYTTVATEPPNFDEVTVTGSSPILVGDLRIEAEHPCFQVPVPA